MICTEYDVEEEEEEESRFMFQTDSLTDDEEVVSSMCEDFTPSTTKSTSQVGGWNTLFFMGLRRAKVFDDKKVNFDKKV